MTLPLTVLIPCKNERDNIGPCIDSVRDLADEILVADSGSTDGTLEFVRTLPQCRVIEREFVNSGDFKNWAIPQSRHEWVFILDADERVSPELAGAIRTVLQHDPPVDGYQVRRKNHFMGHPVRYTSWASDRVTRLVRRDRARYAVYTDHAEIELAADRQARLTGYLIHYTCWEYDAYLQKMLRYTQQQADLWYEQGKQPSYWKLIANGPLRFFRSYVLELGMLDGRVGFQVSALTAFYSFLKQARLWQRHAGRSRAELDVGQGSPATGRTDWLLGKKHGCDSRLTQSQHPGAMLTSPPRIVTSSGRLAPSCRPGGE